jgi:4-hydroxy-3-polyprenylbenzoate decarboxylase
MKPESSVPDIIEEYIRRRRNPLKPILVSKGLCKENIQIGDEIDLFKIPAPMLHEGDGGKYISTWHTVITKDPDSDWVNWGMYRQMIHDKKTLGTSFYPFRHIGIHYYGKYEPNNRPMECAVVIGTFPILFGMIIA